MPRVTKIRIAFYLLALVEVMLLSGYYWLGMALR
jgi:hypothetical protein